MKKFAYLLVNRGWLLPVALFTVALLIAANEFGYRNSSAAAEAIELAQQRRGEVNQLLQTMLDAETNQRGYLILGDDRYRQNFDQAITSIGSQLDSLRKHYVAEEKNLQTFAMLSRNISRKIAEMEVTIKLRTDNPDALNWRSVVATDLGNRYMDDVREMAARLVKSADADRIEANGRVETSLNVSRVGVTIAALLTVIALQLYLRQSKRLVESMKREQNALSSEKGLLQQMVSERTTRLTALANHLQRVQEKEREHLARELHDELGSLLTAAKLDVARVKSRLPADSNDVKERLEHLVQTLNAGIAIKRRIIEDLRPSSLTKLGLVPALEILTREFQTRSGINVTTNFERIRLNDEAALTTYRVAQESLTNIAKYANATEVTVSLQQYANHIELTVTDNGVGFDVARRENSSYGLPGLRHRVDALDGMLEVQSTPGEGTKIVASIPSTSASAEAAQPANMIATLTGSPGA